jgi:2-oxoglutarate dehydrogenase E2 component (dihydrolipoamide succinyltransferase)
MAVELRVPEVGESITEVVIAVWHKTEGQAVQVDETVAELETDKATLELPAPVAGVLSKTLKAQGETAKVGEVIALIEAAAGPALPEAGLGSPETATAPAAVHSIPEAASSTFAGPPRVMPAAARLLAERGIPAREVEPTGPGGRMLKEDVLRHAPTPSQPPPPAQPPGKAVAGPHVAGAPAVHPGQAPAALPPPAMEQVVPMSPIRRRIAERLVEAQHNAALLTSFNEVDMSQVIALRREHQDAFRERFGVKLGFMSFFVKAVIEALKLVPQANAEVRGTDIVYKNYYDIGIAVGGGKGLVVPVLRHADRLSFAEVELAIADFAARGKVNKIDLSELKGGTFTISNGGVYGSLLSTPIVNPPQSAVLGLHVIQDRAVVCDGQVVVRPMMYVALTYDHRLIDGRESVAFLTRVKELIEEPARMLLEM